MELKVTFNVSGNGKFKEPPALPPTRPLSCSRVNKGNFESISSLPLLLSLSVVSPRETRTCAACKIVTLTVGAAEQPKGFATLGLFCACQDLQRFDS
jgi:hypothetical protein